VPSPPRPKLKGFVAAFYLLAKCFETFDRQIFAIGHIVGPKRVSPILSFVRRERFPQRVVIPRRFMESFSIA
jgi:hypothetical protein